ncbi:hypothetical protein C8F01DRAFT_1137777 [Mycena amicta]|nr:hypothetical protein C8F01DRAFT_1137777 [Mycena amicta]
MSLVGQVKNIPPDQQHRLLPAVYAALDPKYLSDVRDIESPNPEVRLRASSSFICLEIIAHLLDRDGVLPDALGDLWPRVWAWVKCLDEFTDIHSTLHPEDPPLQDGILVDVVALCWMLSGSQPSGDMSALISRTSGIPWIIGRYWKHALERNKGRTLVSICQLLLIDPDNWRRAAKEYPQIDVLMSAAGGTWRDLASLLVKHLRLSVPAHAPLTKAQCYCLWGLRPLLNTQFRTNELFRLAALDAGLVPALLKAIRALSITPADVASCSSHATLTFTLCAVLNSIFEGPQDHVCAVQALKEGLLPAMFALSSTTHPSMVDAILPHWLTSELPRLTMYHSVLTELRSSLPEAQGQQFPHPELAQYWDSFCALVELRWQALDAYDQHQVTSRHACDNTLCVAIRDKRELKRCSHCRMSFYCSRSCQKTDWEMFHRQQCPYQRKYRQDNIARMGKKNLSFLRGLVHHDYLTISEYPHPLALDLVRFFWTYAEEDVIPSIFFNYSHGDASYAIHPVNLNSTDSLGFIRHCAAQCVLSDGKMQMHLLTLREADEEVGVAAEALLMMLRCATPTMAEELQVIARKIPQDLKTEDLDVALEGLKPEIFAIAMKPRQQTH